jgi:hypothetical protein
MVIILSVIGSKKIKAKTEKDGKNGRRQSWKIQNKDGMAKSTK